MPRLREGLEDLAWRAYDAAARPLRDRHYLVFPGLGFAYGRVPKAANSSIKRALAGLVGCTRTRGTRGINRDRYWQKVEGVALLTSGALLRDHPGVYTFSVVRNPFGRLVSCHANKLASGRPLTLTWRLLGFSRGMSFQAFVERAASIRDAQADNHFRSQWSLLQHGGALVPGFVGRLETLDRDWAEVRRELSQRCGRDPGELPHTNSTAGQHGPVHDYFRDPGIVRLVRERYRDDFERFYPDAPDPA